MKSVLYALGLLLCASSSLAGPRLAVLDFDVSSSDPSHTPLGQGLRSMVSTDLTTAPDVVVVERERLQAVLDELKLQDSRAVDQKTALELGRLLGATHLVDGSVTVSGERMRLDVRLLDVQSGAIVLGEQIEGERLAFFELEKALVKKLIIALAVELAPKERAALGKLHTADWDAFVAFSEGVSAFDEQRYKEALDALKRALIVDGEFDLAQLTQAQYSAIIDRLQTRSEDLRTAKVEGEKLKLSEKAAAQLNMLEAVQALAALQGDAHLQDRLTGVAMLHALHRDRELTALSDQIDAFDEQRLADHYQRRYMVEARDHAGEVDPDPPGGMYVKPSEWREAFDKLKGELFYTKYEKYKPEVKTTRQLRDMSSCASTSKWANGLFLDVGQRAKLCLARLDIGRAMGADAEWESNFAWAIHDELVDAGMFSEAAKTLLRRADSAENSGSVDAIRSRIEQLQRYDRAVHSATRPELVREAIVLGEGTSFFGQSLDEFAPTHIAGKIMTPKGRWAASHLRNLNNRNDRVPYLLVGDKPWWTRSSLVLWTTGHRPDPGRTESMIYFRPKDPGATPTGQPIDRPALVLYGEQHYPKFRLSLTLSTQPGPDWWPISERFVEGNKAPAVSPGPAAVGFLVGARDIDVGMRRVPGQDPVRHRPFTGWVVEVGQDEVTVDKFTSVGAAYKHEYSREQVARMSRKDRANPTSKIVLTVGENGAGVLSISGKAHAFKIPDYKPGFTGFMLTDTGYAEFSDLALE